MPRPVVQDLNQLDRLARSYGDGFAERKLRLLRGLERRSLRRPDDVVRLHEVLCFLRAYPDDDAVHGQVVRMLEAFARRGDLGRHRAALADTGIAGTAIHFRFFPPTAFWLGRRWGDHLTIDWDSFEQHERLDELLPQLALFPETPGLDGYDLGSRGWIEEMRGPNETDAAFLLGRLDQLRMSPIARETQLESLAITFTLSPGPDTPSRTRELHPLRSLVFQTGPLCRRRPELAEALSRPPRSSRRLEPREGQALLDLSRAAMVTRERDLQAFSYGNREDVWAFDCGRGLHIACIGVIPEQRYLLETLYGFLLLRNGVPVGYGSYTALFGSVEIAFTVFDTFRSGEAAWMYGRVLSLAHHLFECDVFGIDAYQVGQDNEDAIQSGAWWFYQKLGFRPRDAGLRRLMREEQRKMRSRPSHRSTPKTLRKLASENLFLHLGEPRDDVVGLILTENVGLRVTEHLAKRFGHDRNRAERQCAREAMKLLGVRRRRRLSADDRLAWQRWGPLILALPGISRWSSAARRDLVAVVRAKGGPHELDYHRRVDRHRPLRRAILKLAAD